MLINSGLSACLRRLLAPLPFVVASLLARDAFAQTAQEFDGDVLLGRPTDTSISVSVMAHSDQHVYVEYGRRAGRYEERTAAMELLAERPHVFELTQLQGDTAYFYRLRFKGSNDDEFLETEPADFHTQRARGSAFSFAVEADSHMGAKTRHQKWCPTCGRELADELSVEEKRHYDELKSRVTALLASE